MVVSIDIMPQVVSCLKDKKNFLLSGGAGSGKTYTLIQTLHSVYENNINSKVACITYTNVAANEIKARSPFTKLWVSTIHDFLWNIIKGYQNNLIKTVIELISNDKLSYSGETPKEEITITAIEYKNYRKLEDGIITHDDLLKIAEYMFEHYPLLGKILCDKFDYIFIDEYQDTQEAVKNIFLKYINEKATGRLCLGFFGDKMQSIYETGIVDIQMYVDSGQVSEVLKTDNYRCSKAVIKLLNNLRSDLIQQPAKKNYDGSIANKTGSALFLYSNNDFDLSTFSKTDYVKTWDFNNVKETKLLFLTYKLIARRDGWSELLSAYNHNDMLIGNEPDKLAKHLLNVGGILYNFQQKRYDEVIHLINKKVRTITDKKEIASFLNDIIGKINQTTIGTAIESLNSSKLLKKDDKLLEYIENNIEKYETIKSLPLIQLLAYYKYYNNHSPYSTQHGIKGAEFENVLVLMDNGKWNNYNFKYLFESTGGKESVIQRTERMFYVCCSRAMDNLIVYYPSPSQVVLNKAKEWFGEENVKSLNE